MIRIVKQDGDTPEVGPIDREARALLERVLAQKPLAIGIVWESADTTDFQVVPSIDCVRRGLAEMLYEMTTSE